MAKDIAQCEDCRVFTLGKKRPVLGKKKKRPEKKKFCPAQIRLVLWTVKEAVSQAVGPQSGRGSWPMSQ